MELTDTSRIEELLYQLVQQGGANANAAAGVIDNENLPVQRRMVQTAPQYFDNPVANMAYNAFAPMIASHISGGRATQLLPQFNNAVGSYESFYARDITTPLYEAGKQTMMQDYGAGFGITAAQMAGRVGMRPRGMEQGEFEERMANLGATSGGQMLAGALMSTKTMQDIMGGNPMAVYENMFPRAQSLSTPVGSIVNPMDTVAQAGMAENTARFVQETNRAIFMDPRTGLMGITPNASFTRGKSMDDIAKVTANMVDQNYSYAVPTLEGGVGRASMRGMETDPRAKVQMLKDQLALLDTIGQTIQDANIDTQLEMLDKFTQGKAHQINPEVLRGALDNISAMAENLGVSSKSMMTTIMTTQAALSQVGGGSMTGSGHFQGGMASGTVAQYMGTKIQTIAQQTGRPLADVQAEQLALVGIGERSGQGQAINLIEYMKQQGTVDAASYEQYQSAIRTGDKGAQEATMRQIFERSPFGSTEAAMTMMQNEGFRQEIANRSNPETALRALRMKEIAQERELPERTQENVLNNAERMARRMFSDRNMNYDETVTTDKSAREQVRTMQAKLREIGPEGETLAGMLEEQYKRGGTAQEGLQNVRSMVQSNELFAPHAKGLMAAAQDKEIQAAVDKMGSKEGRRQAELSSKLKFMQGVAQGDQTSDRRDALWEVQNAMAGGDLGKAERLLSRQEGRLSKAERAGLQLQVSKDAERDRAQMATLTHMGEGGPMGGSAGLVHAQTAAQWGVSGIGLALSNRAETQDAFFALSQMSGEGAVRHRAMGDMWAGKRETPMQRMVKWVAGRGSVYDVLGVQAPEGGGALADMTPEQVAGMDDKAIGKLAPEQQAQAAQMRDFLKSDEGKAQLASATAAAKALDFTQGLEDTQFAKDPAKLAKMSDEEYAQLSKGERKKTKAAREFFRSAAGADVLGLNAREFQTADEAQAQLEASGGPAEGQQAMVQAPSTPTLFDRYMSGVKGSMAGMVTSGPFGAVSGAIGGLMHGTTEKLAEKTDKTGEQIKHGRASTKLTGTVTLRKESGGVAGTLDFEGAELKE